MKIIHDIKKVLVMMFIITGTINAVDSYCSLQNNLLLPEGYREVGEIITINFDLANTSTTPCPATDGVGVPNMSINIAIDKLIPELVGGIPHVTGAILDYFDVVYDAVDNELDLTQKADVPPNTSNSGIFYVEITGPSITEADTPNIGYIANLSSTEALTHATNSVENFTLTATHPALELEKTVDTSFLASGFLFYSFTVTNTGDSELINVTVDDPRINITGLTLGNIAVGASFSSTPQFYAVTPADIASGAIINSAIASATDIQDRNVTDISDDPTDPTDFDSEDDGEPDDPTVVALTDAPVAVDDTKINQVVGTAVTLDTLGNDVDNNDDINASTVNITTTGATDTDSDGDADELVVTGEGTWTVDNTTGDITFTPEPGFTGDPTSITYNVKDDTGNTSNDATETVDYLEPVPTAPTAIDDSVSGITGTATIVPVLGNDTDPENDLNVSTVNFTDLNATDTDSDGDADELVVAGEGTWTANPDGTVTFTPLATFTGDPTPIQYTVTDDTGLESNEATITIDYSLAAPTVTEVTPDTEIEGTDLNHTVTLSEATGEEEIYTFTIEDNTTTVGDDYSTIYTFSDGVVDNGNGTITVPVGVTSFTIAVSTIGDAVVDDGEFYTITVGDVSATGTITDDGTVPVTISYVHPELHGNTLEIDFSTATEVVNIGFNIYAIKGKKWIKLNEEMIEGAMNSLVPVDYHTTLSLPEDIKIKKIGIAGVDVNGVEDRHGPFKIGKESGSKIEITPIHWEKVQKEVKADKKARKLAKKAKRKAKKAKRKAERANNE